MMLESDILTNSSERSGSGEAAGSDMMQKKLPHEDEDSEDSAQEQKSGEPGGDTRPSESREPGRLNSFVRRTTRKLLVAGLLIVAGMVVGYFVFQQPQVSALNAQVEQLTTEKADLETQVAALQEDVAALGPFEGENRALRASLDEEELHVRLLSAITDVQAAQLNLALGEIDSARLSLSRTETKLEDLQELLPADQQGVVDGMIQRLGLVLDGMDSDAFAAQSDLEVLANSLLQLENTLFIAP